MQRITIGMRVADAVTSGVGSWKFIIIQSVLLAIWMAINSMTGFRHWDEYPYVLLNLALSFQAAFTAPFLLMSANRQNDRDRKKAEKDYHINVKAEQEIQTLHTKMDLMKEKEMKELLDIIKQLVERLPHEQTN